MNAVRLGEGAREFRFHLPDALVEGDAYVPMGGSHVYAALLRDDVGPAAYGEGAH